MAQILTYLFKGICVHTMKSGHSSASGRDAVKGSQGSMIASDMNSFIRTIVLSRAKAAIRPLREWMP